MNGFLYFKPGLRHHPTPDDISQWGLDYALAAASLTSCVCQTNTPTGQPGVVFADASRLADTAIRMDMDAQSWGPVPNTDMWVGYWRDRPKPAPADLIRARYLPGYQVRLADGVEWVIPLVRRFDQLDLASTSNLPTYMRVEADGRWRRADVLEIHAHLWEATRPIADALLAEYVWGESLELTDDDIYHALLALLQTNYVVGPGELSLLRAITSEATTHAAVMAACDWPAFEAWAATQKKTPPPAQANPGE